MLKKKNSSVYFSKFLPAVRHYNNKKLTIKDYNNIDLLSSYNKQYIQFKIRNNKIIRK